MKLNHEGKKIKKKLSKKFPKKNCSFPPRKLCNTNKTDVYYIDDTWRIDLIDLNDYGPKTNKVYRYIIVVIDNFSRFGWTVSLKIKNAQTIEHSFENILNCSKKTEFN